MKKELNEFALLKDIEQEYKEIEIFFDQVGNVKSKIIQEKKTYHENKMFLTDEEIIKLLYNNVSIFNVITDDTVKVYIETFFKKSTVECSFKFTEEALETFLTSILIFAQD